MDDLPLTARAREHGSRVAIVDPDRSYRYAELLEASARVAAALLAGAGDLREARVAYFVPPGFGHVAVQWGIWRAGGIAVPLALSHPPPELQYVIRDADATLVVSDPLSAPMLAPLAAEAGARFVTSDVLLAAETGALPGVALSRRAMMVYTSGTTGKPKGVVTTHANLAAQITALIEAWEWAPEDRILLVLPLHHVHGIVNVVCCALWAGAECQIPPRFDAAETWQRIAAARLTLFMAVPTIYARLIAAWDAALPEAREAMSAGCRAMRLIRPLAVCSGFVVSP